MNLADPELELIDPTPNIYSLFIHFDKVFFYTKLASRAVVRWSKRMFSSAGVCSYEGRGGLCDIALSEPLLKLRPRKNLIETLLHEMIHAYLFVTNMDRERDGHGANFQAHMHRINRAAGINITIYHDFHDEVELYLTHWWRCDGPCQKMKPYFGIVRRTLNKAPGPSDHWWSRHQMMCGGLFIKIQEPEKKVKKSKTPSMSKSNGDITKYINNNNNKQIKNNNTKNERIKTITPSTNSIHASSKCNDTKIAHVIQTAKGSITKSPSKNSSFVEIFTGKGQIIDNKRKRRNSTDVTETVRNIWANKQIPSVSQKPTQRISVIEPTSNLNISNAKKVAKPSKHKANDHPSDLPSSKIKKIDDYFKTTANSLLKDVYGKDFVLGESNNKIIAIKEDTSNLVDCPICSEKVEGNQINRHIDECLNKDIIETYKKDNNNYPNNISDSGADKKVLNEIVGVLQPIPAFKNNVQNQIKSDIHVLKQTSTRTTDTGAEIVVDLTNMNTATSGIATINVKKAIDKEKVHENNIRRTDNFQLSNENECNINLAKGDIVSIIKIESGSSDEREPKCKCLCCGNVINKPMAEHLDECLAFFDNNGTAPQEGASTSFANDTIVIDSDEEDIFDETMTLNATGTKSPCPCCLEMIEMSDMNNHLNICLR